MGERGSVGDHRCGDVRPEDDAPELADADRAERETLLASAVSTVGLLLGEGLLGRLRVGLEAEGLDMVESWAAVMLPTSAGLPLYTCFARRRDVI